MTSLAEVRQATRQRTTAEARWREKIRQAVAGGQTLRAVAQAAGVSHVRVLQITREEKS